MTEREKLIEMGKMVEEWNAAQRTIKCLRHRMLRHGAQIESIAERLRAHPKDERQSAHDLAAAMETFDAAQIRADAEALAKALEDEGRLKKLLFPA